MGNPYGMIGLPKFQRQLLHENHWELNVFCIFVDVSGSAF